jgi:hypothetical protein
MVARGTFDDSIRSELRGRGNVNRGDAQQEARDRAARKANVKSGKNPNPRTSTAMKTEPDRPAKSKSKGGGGGGRKNVPTPRDRPSPMHPNSPDRTKDDPLTASPNVPAAEGPGIEGLITSLLLQRLIAQRGVGGANELPPGESGIRLPSMEGMQPPTEVPLQRVPNDVGGNLLNKPGDQRLLEYNPADVPPPADTSMRGAPDAPDNFAMDRFFNEGEIKHMQDVTPGIERMPGAGTRRMPLGPHKLPRVP